MTYSLLCCIEGILDKTEYSVVSSVYSMQQQLLADGTVTHSVNHACIGS